MLESIKNNKKTAVDGGSSPAHEEAVEKFIAAILSGDLHGVMADILLRDLEKMDVGDEMALSVGLGVDVVKKNFSTKLTAEIQRLADGYLLTGSGDIEGGFGVMAGSDTGVASAQVKANVKAKAGGEWAMKFADEKELLQFLSLQKMPTDPLYRAGLYSGVGAEIEAEIGAQVPLWDSEFEALLSGGVDLGVKRGLYVQGKEGEKTLVYQWDLTGAVNGEVGAGLERGEGHLGKEINGVRTAEISLQKHFSLNDREQMLRTHTNVITITLKSEDAFKKDGVKKEITIKPQSLRSLADGELLIGFLKGDVEKGLKLLDAREIPYSVEEKSYDLCGDRTNANINAKIGELEAFVETQITDVGKESGLCE